MTTTWSGLEWSRPMVTVHVWPTSLRWSNSGLLLRRTSQDSLCKSCKTKKNSCLSFFFSFFFLLSTWEVTFYKHEKKEEKKQTTEDLKCLHTVTHTTALLWSETLCASWLADLIGREFRREKKRITWLVGSALGCTAVSYRSESVWFSVGRTLLRVTFTLPRLRQGPVLRPSVLRATSMCGQTRRRGRGGKLNKINVRHMKE